MTTDRQLKMHKELRKLASDFISSISNRQSMITVTNIDTSPDFRNATIYVTVLPESHTETAMAFLERNRMDMRDYIKKKLHTKTIPFLTIKHDLGEKNRQRIDELLSED